jgi:magnesium transporter
MSARLLQRFFELDPADGSRVIVAGASMLLSLAVAGAAIPMALKAMRWDPAQSSSIVLTTVTDIVGIGSVLGFALLFERHPS